MVGAHRALLHTLVWRVEPEGAEQGHTGAVVQHRQVSLRELEGRWALLQQLPRGVQEEQEHRSLAYTQGNEIQWDDLPSLNRHRLKTNTENWTSNSTLMCAGITADRVQMQILIQ